MNTIHFHKEGDSVTLNIETELLDHLEEGGRASIAMDKGRLIIRCEKAPRYTLEELIRETDITAMAADKEDVWMTGGPVGRELL